MRTTILLSGFVIAAFVYGQTVEKPVSFDVASVKSANPNMPDGRIVVGMVEPTGGPGTNDPGRIHYPVINLKMLLLNAYDVKPTQLVGPDWLDTEYFRLRQPCPQAQRRRNSGRCFRTCL